jgi:hypothetical protein
MKTARRIAAAKAVAAIAGVVTVVLGVATGNWPMVFAAAAVAAGAGLLAAVADLREMETRCEASGRLHQMEAAIEQNRGRELGIKERMTELRSYYAGLDGGEGGTGQFRERVSVEPEPGRDRGH